MRNVIIVLIGFAIAFGVIRFLEWYLGMPVIPRILCGVLVVFLWRKGWEVGWRNVYQSVWGDNSK